MHMGMRAYANEMLMRLDRFLDENLSLIIFLKLRSHFYCFLKKSFLVCSDKIYIKTIYLVNRTDIIHMLHDFS